VSRLDLAIRGGRVFDAGVADIGVADGRIAQIGGEFEAATNVDASGKLVLPGGVDAHVHLSSPPGEAHGPRWVDDFRSGSAAALAGGITTVGNMTFGADAESPLQALQREAGAAAGQTVCDLFLHPVIGDPDARALDDILHLLEQGHSSVKIFLSNPRFDRHIDAYVEAIRRAGASGLMTMLHLTDEVFERPACGRFVGQPPVRSASDVAAMWAGLAQGLVDTLCTDHAPWSLQAKLDPELSIERLRPGVENLQLMLPMLYSEGVRTGRISLRRMVELTSSNAARLFGLYPGKGAIAVGSDADLVVFDPHLERAVAASMLRSNADYSVYEGWHVTGWPILTLRRGEIVFRDDQVVGQPGSGRVLACGPAGHP
jgi:dihydroorotase-like cyclic amidohydrolase